MKGAEGQVMNEDHLDFLKEVLTIGVGRSSEILSEMLGTRINLFIPSINQMRLDELIQHFPAYQEREMSVIDLQFRGKINGESKLIFPLDSARLLGNIILEEDESEDFDSAKIGVLTEIGNIVLNSIMGTISNFLKIPFEYQIPIYQTRFYDKSPGESDRSQEIILLANTRFSAEDVSVQGDIALLFSLESLEYLTNLIDSYMMEL